MVSGTNERSFNSGSSFVEWVRRKVVKDHFWTFCSFSLFPVGKCSSSFSGQRHWEIERGRIFGEIEKGSFTNWGSRARVLSVIFHHLHTCIFVFPPNLEIAFIGWSILSYTHRWLFFGTFVGSFFGRPDFFFSRGDLFQLLCHLPKRRMKCLDRITGSYGFFLSFDRDHSTLKHHFCFKFST